MLFYKKSLNKKTVFENFKQCVRMCDASASAKCARVAATHSAKLRQAGLDGVSGSELGRGFQTGIQIRAEERLKMSENKSINKQEIIKEYALNEGDTGSCEVQVAILSARIAHLTNHLSTNKKDFHSRRGLIAMTSRRRKLLDYLKRTSLDRYNALIQRLKLRR